MRVFVALDLPERFKRELIAATAELRERRRDLRWSPQENIHLTLAFLGEIDRLSADRAVEAARSAAASFYGFPLSAGGLKAFPRRGAARILAAGFSQGSGECASLAGLLEDSLRRVAGETGTQIRPPDERLFTAHATLARAGRAQVRFSEADLNLRLNGTCMAKTLGVYESVLERGGPRYSALAVFPLGG